MIGVRSTMPYIFIDDGSYFKVYNGKFKTDSYLNYNIINNELKIEDIQSDDRTNHLGTEMIIKFLENYALQGIVFTRLYGRFAVNDAKENWDKSISFFQHLPIYIYDRLGVQYKFHLYYDKSRTIEITDCYTKEQCLDILINEHLITGKFMSFDLFLK